MGDRCLGNCCREFALPATPDALRQDAANAEERGELALRDEFLKIADLAVPVRTISKDDPMPNGKPYAGEGEVPIYTCRFFDLVTKNCTTYETRPNMCRGYPYDRPCEHGDACAFDDAREGRHPGKVSLPVLS